MNADKSIRAFIAIALDQTLRESIGNIQGDLKKTGADVKWVKPDNIHLTLKFLGQTPEGKIDDIAEVMRAAVKSISQFTFELPNLGAFPKIERPRIIWLGSPLKQQNAQIALNLEKGLNQLGFKKEDREFKVHVTIGRIRSRLNQFALSEALMEYKLEKALTQKVNEIHLYKSTLTKEGPIYEIIKTAKL